MQMSTYKENTFSPESTNLRTIQGLGCQVACHQTMQIYIDEVHLNVAIT